MPTVYVITGLGYGDECKGATVDFLNPKYVIRIGGPQARHNVVTREGKICCFAQIGSATLKGARTHLSKHMLIEPGTLFEDACELERDYGIRDIFDRITIDEECLVITRFQMAACRLREIARSANPHGTTGFGVGDTILDAESGTCIQAKDFGKPWLSDKIEAIRELKLKQLESVLDQVRDLPAAQEELSVLYNQELVEEQTHIFSNLRCLFSIVDGSYLDWLLQQEGEMVIEGSQGVLLDRWYGWNPHTTMVRTTPDYAINLLEEHGFRGKIIKLGLTRAYQTRHGTGPFVTEDHNWRRIIKDFNNGLHPWQGRFRVGPLDAVALRYAINVCGGPKAFDGLVVSCLDQMAPFETWSICTSYNPMDAEADLSSLYVMEAGKATDIQVWKKGFTEQHLKHQAQVALNLRACFPNLEAYDPTSFLGAIEEQLGIPVAISSHGPRDIDRTEHALAMTF